MALNRLLQLAVPLAAVALCAVLGDREIVAQRGVDEQEANSGPQRAARRLAAERAFLRAKRRVAQPIPPSGQNGSGALVMADRRMIQRLQKAGQLIGKQNFTDAATLLQGILDQPEDEFYHPDPQNKSSLRSLKSQAQRLLVAMPDEGRRVYELQYGATAKAMLDEATVNHDLTGVAKVSRRFFSTDAGRRAAYHVGSAHFDRGRPLAAALCFSQLLARPDEVGKLEPALSLKTALCWARAGMPEKSRGVLVELKNRLDGGTVRIGERDVALFGKDDDALAWLTRVFGARGNSRQPLETDWVMFRGNAARNGMMTAQDDRHLTAWPAPQPTVYDVTRFPTDAAETENDRRLQQAVRDVGAMHEQQQRVWLPQSQPLLVNETLYVRTIGSILALDPHDGSKRWETLFDPTSERLLGESENDTDLPLRSRMLQMLVGQRIWGDATWGRMSSDGRYLYAVEGLGLAGIIQRPQRKLVQPARTNTLVAYHLTGSPRAGQRAWTLGGGVGDPLFDHPLAGTFFLGAPLPLGGQLYCLAEVEGEIRLLVIDPDHPEETVWSQPLVGASQPIDRDAVRRQSGTSVSYADGVMVCPTGAGYVVAIDLTRQSLLWAFRYQTADNPPGVPIPRPRPPQPAGNRHWIDPAATIADGKVLLTPCSGHEVLCLNLLDGSIAWRKTKQDGLYLAGVVDGKVLLVGSNSVEALALEDGSAAWKNPAAIAAPSGRGFIRGGRLYLPLSTAEIGVIDIATGVVALTVKTPHEIVPGNLIAVGDAVVSQGVDGVNLFAVPEIEKKVAARDADR